MSVSKRNWLIIGGGSHAKVLGEILNCHGGCIKFVVSKKKPDQYFRQSIWIDNDDLKEIDKSEFKGLKVVNGLGSTRDVSLRSGVYLRFVGMGYSFESVFHTSAVISKETSLGLGVQVMAGAVIQIGSTLGDNVLVNTRSSIDHDCTIGKSVHIAPGAVLSGGVSIQENCHIGTGATIIQNICIGKNSVIGAGVTVLSDVPENTIISAKKSLVWPYLKGSNNGF